MRKKRATELSSSLPPKIPPTPESLERAISLLGNRTQQELKEKARQELIELINAYPDASTAANWKKNLRQLSKNPDDYDALKNPPNLQNISLNGQSSGELTPETQIMFSWVSQALHGYYLDDEGYYDPQLVEKMQMWLNFPETMPPQTFLAKRFLEINIALCQSPDPFEFDLAEVDFEQQQPIMTSLNQMSFIEPLLRQALLRVDWCVIGDYLIEKLSLKFPRRHKN